MATVPAAAPSTWLTRDGVALPRPAAGTASRPLAIGRIARDALLIVGLLLLNKLGSTGAVIFFLVLAGMILRGPRSAYKALAIAMIGLMINTAFVPKTLVWTPARLLVFPLALLRFLADLSGRRVTVFSKPSYFFFMLYVVTMVFCSVASGWYAEVALLKLLMFWIAITTVFAGTAVLRASGIDMSEWTVSLIAAVTIIGGLAMAFGVHTSRGNPLVEESTGFIGAFLHPNAHTIFAPQFVTFLACLAVLGSYERRWIALALIPVWLTFMSWSGARTSFGAVVAGSLVLFLMAGPFRNRWGCRLRTNVSRGQLILVFAAVGVALLLYDLGTNQSLTKAFVAFVNKGGDSAEVNIDTAMQSRRPLIEACYNNFLESPIYGIGFQVSKDAFFLRNVTLFSAPVEKGFLPTAVLEEGGILGATTLILFLLALYQDAFASRSVPAIVTLTTFLFSNLGEVSLFSVGGSGAFGWVMFGLATILGDHCWRTPSARLAASAPPKTPVALTRHGILHAP